MNMILRRSSLSIILFNITLCIRQQWQEYHKIMMQEESSVYNINYYIHKMCTIAVNPLHLISPQQVLL